MPVEPLWKFDLTRGHSDTPATGACLLDAVSWIEYGVLDDHPKCVCPVLAAYGRTLNDGLNHVDRQRLRPFISLLVDTVDPPFEHLRGMFLIQEAARRVVPLALECMKGDVFHRWADTLREQDDDYLSAFLAGLGQQIDMSVSGLAQPDRDIVGWVRAAVLRVVEGLAQEGINRFERGAWAANVVRAAIGSTEYNHPNPEAHEKVVQTALDIFREAIDLGGKARRDLDLEQVNKAISRFGELAVA